MRSWLSKLVVGVLVVSPVITASSADRLKIISESRIGETWVPAPGVKRVEAGYPGTAERGRDVCVVIGFKIQPDGSTSDFGLLNAWDAAKSGKRAGADSVEQFMQMAAAAVSMRRYSPATGVDNPTVAYTAATFAFAGSGKLTKESIQQHCEISDLGDFILRRQEEAYRRGDLKKSQLDRYQRDFTPLDAAAQRDRDRGKHTPR